MFRLFAFLLLLAGCRDADPPPAVQTRAATSGPCRPMFFEGSRFTLCMTDGARLSLVVMGSDGQPFGSFAAYEQAVGRRADKVAFAMNAGVYGTDGLPIGLAVVDGRELHAINRRKGGGNFHLQPNGVFFVRANDHAAISPTERFGERTADLRLATQSGPMLVINGTVNPRFDRDGSSRYVRNGVGVDERGRVLFAISDDLVSFGKFARLFRNAIGCRNALYLDGSVSSLWDPTNGRMDSFSRLGPMIVAVRP